MTTPGASRGADFVLTLSCADIVGIVHAVSGFLVEHGCNIIDSAQFGDPDTQRFFMRVAFASGDAPVGELRDGVRAGRVSASIWSTRSAT